MSINKMKTLARAGIEKVIVERIAYRLFALPANLTILVTLSTLITLAILGRTASTDPPPILSKMGNSSRKSKIDAQTTKKSNLFHELLK